MVLNMDLRRVGHEYHECIEMCYLMKDGEDPLDRSCEEWRSIAKSQRGEKCLATNKKKEDHLDRPHLA